MQVVHCGRMDYAAALETQERLAAAVAAGTAPETLLLLEHPAVYTIGRGGDATHLLDPYRPLDRIAPGKPVPEGVLDQVFIHVEVSHFAAA